MKNKRTNTENVISIYYLKESLSLEDINDLEKIVTEESVILKTSDYPSKYIMGIEQFFPTMKVILSSDLAMSIYGGLITNGICAVINKMLVSIKDKIKNKKITKIHNGKFEENSAPTIHVIIGNIHVILPTEISDEQYQFFVNNLFDAIKGQNIKEVKYCLYNPETKEYRFLSKHEIAFNEDTNKSK